MIKDFCKNEHNIEEKPSPDPELCLHCWFLELNAKLNAKLDNVKSSDILFKEIPCQCGCEDICPECDGQGEYISSINNKLKKCDECKGTGEITDETNPDHECGDWIADDIDFDDETHASIDRECPTCHQLSRLHFWKKSNEVDK